MSSQLASISPLPPLTDDVFIFNQLHFVDIREHQEQDLKFLSSEPVRAVVKVTGKVGGTATKITSGVAHGVHDGASSLFDKIGKVTRPLPGGGLLHKVGQGVLKGIDKSEHIAEQLVDPTRVVREHVTYSNDVKDNLPDAVTAVEKSMHEFAYEIGNRCQELYENIPTKGVQIITGLEGRVVEVCDGLSKMIEVLTKNDIQESLKVGAEKYHVMRHVSKLQHSLEDISVELPKVIQSVRDVKGAFETILANLKLAKEKINNGITDPNQIFAQKYEVVVVGWQTFEAKRKTMTL